MHIVMGMEMRIGGGVGEETRYRGLGQFRLFLGWCMLFARILVKMPQHIGCRGVPLKTYPRTNILAFGMPFWFGQLNWTSKVLNPSSSALYTRCLVLWVRYVELAQSRANTYCS